MHPLPSLLLKVMPHANHRLREKDQRDLQTGAANWMPYSAPGGCYLIFIPLLSRRLNSAGTTTKSISCLAPQAMNVAQFTGTPFWVFRASNWRQAANWPGQSAARFTPHPRFWIPSSENTSCHPPRRPPPWLPTRASCGSDDPRAIRGCTSDGYWGFVRFYGSVRFHGGTH